MNQQRTILETTFQMHPSHVVSFLVLVVVYSVGAVESEVTAVAPTFPFGIGPVILTSEPAAVTPVTAI